MKKIYILPAYTNDKDERVSHPSIPLETYTRFCQQLTDCTELEVQVLPISYQLNQLPKDGLLLCFTFGNIVKEILYYKLYNSPQTIRRLFLICNACLQEPKSFLGLNFAGITSIRYILRYFIKNQSISKSKSSSMYVDVQACSGLERLGLRKFQFISNPKGERHSNIVSDAMYGYKCIKFEKDFVVELGVYLKEYLQKFEDLQHVDHFIHIHHKNWYLTERWRKALEELPDEGKASIEVLKKQGISEKELFYQRLKIAIMYEHS